MAKKAAGKTGKKSTAKKPEPAAPKVPEFQLIGQKDFETLARRCASLQNQVSEHSGSMGELVKDAAENKNLHRGAFALWRKLDRMGKKDPEKLATFLAHWDYYRGLKIKDKSLDDIAAEQAQMFARSEAGDDEGEEAEEGTESGSRVRVVGGTDQKLAAAEVG